ncbi:MAG: hypothetical protein LBE24_04170 [Methylobacillus sp.]|jgi:hypothetical protein|nr:hypothetical protein [Methylobacillus sp.]
MNFGEVTEDRQRALGLITDELRVNWSEWVDHVDPQADFGQCVAAILADSGDDKLGRINDLHQAYLDRCAEYALNCDQWYGSWGRLKRAAGLSEPTPYDYPPPLVSPAIRAMYEAGHRERDFA